MQQVTRTTRTRRRRRAGTVATSAAVLALSCAGVAAAATSGFGTAHVGDTTPTGLVLPDDQTIRPLGDRLLVDDGKLTSSTLSPDGRHLASLCPAAARC